MFNVYEEFDPDYIIEIDGVIEYFHDQDEYNEFLRIKKIKLIKNRINESILVK